MSTQCCKKTCFAFVLLLITGGFLPGIVLAQYYFGRNKVIYNQFDWHILQTEHFEIYYYPQMRELAEIGAAYAEETYTYLERKFNHNLGQRVPLIFYATHAHFQETNTIPYLIPEGVGGFFEFLKGRVVVPANGSIPQFKHVIRHELIHVFTHSKANRIIKDNKIFNHPGLPLWFVEGLAEYWSTGWDTQAEMFIRDATIHEYLFPVSSMYQISGSFLMYKEGQAVMKYISEQYGDDKILQLIENIWMRRNFSEIMKVTLGDDYKEFDEKWTYHLKKEKFPLLQDHDSADRISHKLTEHGINIKPAYYQQADSQYVVFISNRSGYSNIYLEPVRKSRHEPKSEILVAGERSSEFESFHLLSSSIDVNPQGELVFYPSGENDVLYIYDLDKREIIDQAQFGDLVSLFSPSWSPDARSISFAGLAFNGKCDLFIYQRESKKLTKLTDDAFDDRDPAFSPDGRFLAFSSDRGMAGEKGYYNLFSFELETGRVQYMTHGPFNDQMPRWSPDGEYLAFTSDRSGTINIWMLKTNGGAPREQIVSAAVDAGLSVPVPAQQPYFTTALREQFPLRQITHVITGAMDPEWTDRGDLLFTAFEKFSFQLHLIEDATRLFKEAEIKPPDSLDQVRRPWAFKRISGESTLQDFKYKPKFNLDVAQSQITQDPIFGTSGGAQLAISDMLGNYQYFFLLYNTARTKDEFLSSFNVAVSRVDLSRRTNFAIGAYHFAGRFYNLYDYWFWERRFGGFGALSYPLSKFARVEASLNVRHSEKEWFANGYQRKALLVSNFVSYIKDNSLWGPTGPIDGTRLNITLGNTMDVVHSNVNFVSTILDYRRYYRISTLSSHAVRVWTQINHGKEATPFFMGGSWDLRGYRFWRLWGTKLALVSNELRFPFIDRFIVNFPFGGMAFNAIRGALFFDMGNAWDDKLDYLLGSTGFGVRMNFGGMLVLRLDVGRKFVLDDINRFYRTDVYKFENKWFTQFFFGWDF